jgi:hypothetical protein
LQPVQEQAQPEFPAAVREQFVSWDLGQVGEGIAVVVQLVV